MSNISFVDSIAVPIVIIKSCLSELPILAAAPAILSGKETMNLTNFVAYFKLCENTVNIIVPKVFIASKVFSITL